ncbi:MULTISPECIES: DEAD/DEAH box helicase [unclassified Mesorhizobium]|uniref:DEAD/DEAH box helicase n=1 Tax=unclassified Mesorhizobium TaxID=325217 RepID=UPI00112AD2C7|nr:MULTISPECIES: DEAD/DEAH box helicase [unclassified Mesorhizobium]TPM10493.1 hypothetical protein FJ939_01100 [Mesorhizobium sp. B2-3-8]TPM20490.1 hypothetical protein FJ940_02805 [Mesorhizobium sp. B2-3-7]
MITQQGWEEIQLLSGNELKTRVFSLIREIAGAIQEREIDDPDVTGSVPRLAKLILEKKELFSYREIFSTLARSVGLWNYIDTEAADTRDEIIAESVTVPELGGITLHREQVAALNTLLSGKNLILSAPTSFGKSLLIDALIASGRYQRLAIVLPTIALLDEFRRRLISRFSEQYSIVMYHSEVAPAGNVIFLGTQERLINRKDLGRLDIAIVDEFYKLDPNRQDDRSMTLNAAVYQLLRRSNQFFFLGPNIEGVRFSTDSRWRFEFLKTRFSTVAVDTFDLADVDNKEERLTQEAFEERNWPVLVFVSSPDRANSLADQLSEHEEAIGEGGEISTWFDKNFGMGWALSRSLATGIGVHHGRIPRALASQFVRMFNNGGLPILICTSTLIEGVNTAAKSVLIYDKTINKQDYDFFTFSNIRGRAGRLGQHFVGSVFLFNSPPPRLDVEVEPPLFGDLDEAPDELVVHISDEDLSPRLTDRLDDIAERLDLTQEELRIASVVGLDQAIAIRQHVDVAARNGADIFWHGYPSYEQIGAVCEIICNVRQPSSFGVFTHKQLTFYLHELRKYRPIRDFFFWYTNNYKGGDANQDNIFKFLRSCEYGLPQLFSVVEMFARRKHEDTNYGLFTAEMPRWFRPEVLKNLDEQGIPIQISERFYLLDDTVAKLSKRIRDAAQIGDSRLTEFETGWILAAIPI